MEIGDWFEVWAEDSGALPYILLAVGGRAPLRVIDPREGNRVVFSSESYEDVRNWLNEDEFERVSERIVIGPSGMEH